MGPPLTSPPVASAAEISIARLHGEACWHCGAVYTELVAAGTVTAAGADGPREWPVVACPSHRGMPLESATEGAVR